MRVRTVQRSTSLLELAQDQLRLGQFREAQRTLHSCRLPPEHSDFHLHRALTAQARMYLGDSPGAVEIASALMAEDLSTALHARSEFVIAQAHLQDGKNHLAIPRFQSSSRNAAAAGDLELACVASLCLLRAHGATSRSEHLTTLLNEVRASVARAENPDLFAWLHISYGHIEAREGSVSQARRHYHNAASLLTTSENIHLKGLLEIELSALATISGDLEEAIRHAKTSFDVSQRSGHARVHHGAASNLGLLYLLIGDFRESAHYLAYARRLASKFLEIRLSVLDTLAQLELYNGDYEACARAIAAIEASRAVDVLTDWQLTGALETRARLLSRMNRWQEARSVLNDALRLAQDNRDPLQSRLFRILRAEAALEENDFRAYEEDLAAVVHHTDDSPALFLGEIERVQGKAEAKAGHLARAKRHFQRAAVVFSVLKHACRYKDVELNWAAWFGRDLPLLETPWDANHQEHVTDRSPLEPADVSRLIDLASNTSLLAREAFQMMRHAVGVVGVALTHEISTKQNVLVVHGWNSSTVRRRLTTSALHQRIQFDVSPNESYWLIFEAGASLESEVHCAALARLVLAAMALEKRNQDQRQREPLWPVDLPADSADGVFISPKTVELLGVARKVAVTDMPVLITGETGTGKEVIAQAVHRASKRAHESMLPFNCSTVPRDLLDAQLFGYRRGSFTGAHDNFPGIIRGSAGGTLFLDEIAEMPIDLQPKLLRFLESREIHPLGETRPTTVDVRVIAATNVDLEQLVAAGRFREDLYYRLNVIRLRIPPLRERREEIPALSQRFLEQHARDLRKLPPRLTEETMEYLLLYRWPGNVRQLSNELRRIAALTDADALVGPEHLSDDIRASRRTLPAEAVPAGGVVVQQDQPLDAAVADLERAFILRALERSGGNFEEAAKALGLSRKGLYLKRQRLGIAP